jgi:hypothetical protein
MREIDAHLQAPHVGEAGAPAARRENAVVEQDIGVDRAGKITPVSKRSARTIRTRSSRARRHSRTASEARRAGAAAATRQVKAAVDRRQPHIVGRHQSLGRLRRRHHLPREIEILGPHCPSKDRL